MSNLHETKVYKNYAGRWVAESHIDLDNDLVLTIKTQKSSDKNTILSIASVAKIEGLFLKHTLHVDYYVLINASECNRVTKNAIEKAHIFALSYDNEVIKQVNAFYNLGG
jgi:hypothetical protein